jgi:hypothetical protein
MKQLTFKILMTMPFILKYCFDHFWPAISKLGQYAVVMGQTCLNILSGGSAKV